MEEKRTRKLDGLPKPFLASLEKRHGEIDYKNDFVSVDLDNYFKYQGTDKETGEVSHKVIALPSFKNLYLNYEDLVQDVKELQGKEGVREDKRARELFELIKTNFRKLQRYLREERPEQYQTVRTKYNETALESLTTESLRDWFKKEKWVRITTSGNIAGACGTSKNKKNPDRCLPKAKAQSLSKAERAATARKKKKAGKKGKTVVKNTKKAKVTRENLQAAINILKEEKDYAPYLEQIIDKLKSLDVSIDYLSAAITDQSALGVSVDQDTLNRFASPDKKRRVKENQDRTWTRNDMETYIDETLGGYLERYFGYNPGHPDHPMYKMTPKQFSAYIAQEMIGGIDELLDEVDTNINFIRDVLEDAYEERKKIAIGVGHDPDMHFEPEEEKVGADALGMVLTALDKMATPTKLETANPQDGKAAPYGSGYKPLNKEQIETLLEKCWKGYQKKGMKTMFGKKVPNCVKKEDIINLVVGTMHEMQNESSMMEKDDRCTRLAKRRYDTWPSAYASGFVVRCRQGKIMKKK